MIGRRATAHSDADKFALCSVFDDYPRPALGAQSWRYLEWINPQGSHPTAGEALSLYV